MFGLFARKTSCDPLTFDAEAHVHADADHVRDLVDPSSDGFMLLDRGFVRTAAGSAYRFEDPSAPGTVFEMSLEEGSEPGMVAYTQKILSPAPIGLFDWGRTSWHIERGADGQGCHVTMTETVQFLPARSESRMRQEAAVYAIAIHNSITKLKIQAEEGIDVLRQMEADHLEAMT